MPTLKASYGRLKGFDPASLPALATRLAKVRFDMSSDTQVIGTDRGPGRLSVELALRREREGLAYDDAKGALVVHKGYEYARRYFTLEAESAVASTPGGRRDLTLFTELLKRCGAGGVELLDLRCDMAAWARDFLHLYDSAQLGGLVIDNYYAEPKLMGRYAAKTVDNRIDLKLIGELAGKLRSIRFSFFYEGLRRSAEARVDGVLSVSSSDEEDVASFFGEQQRLYLKHCHAGKKDED